MNEHMPLPPRNEGRSSRAPKAVRPPRKPRRLARFVFSFLLIVIIGLASYAGYLYIKADNLIGDISNPKENKVAAAERAQVKPIGLLVLGLDNRQETGSLNTDVMMAATFNPKTKTATVVSVPRDSTLNLNGYKTRKANAYYARFLSVARSEKNLTGDEASQYAKDQMKEMMSEFFGIPIDYTAVLDFQGFIDVVDALGGVNVNVDQDMRYWDNADGTDINLKKGVQELNGKDALGFVRYRKSKQNITRPSSDFERNARQDQVLGAIVDKLKSFSSVTKVGGVLDAVGNNLHTDIPKQQIENMISTYFRISKQNIRFIALEGTWKSPYVYLDQTKLDQAKEALREELRPEGRPVSEPASSAATDNG
ncbi:LytR family transcriptional regulator [Cohnella pontilimi]|uniref:LytR family transcriptional regulator n=1 Tax=Cohnella pontilimi TaxID=2564100 RepID=A0A4U0FEX2_9BACL|nr:LCP family protein [Cohnella pontilimi]TJY43397.1 LytR family transcriptional regulator [Cohnella pontilimi]